MKHSSSITHYIEDYWQACLTPAGRLVLPKIARSQSKSARAESGLTEGEVALATSREDRPLSAEVSWSGMGELCVSPV